VKIVNNNHYFILM